MVNHWQIIQPGLHSSFQDSGRPHYAHLGVPISGALDLPSAHYANKLLGNDANEAVIEITLTGLSFKTYCDCSIVITGAVFSCHVNDKAVDHWQTINLKADDIFTMKKMLTGTRAYLAVAGGFAISKVLNSASTLCAARLGGFQGRTLQAKDIIPLNHAITTSSRTLLHWKRPKIQNIHVIRAAPGPEYDLFDVYSQQSVWQQAFEVTQDSNRMGMRLHNEYQLKSLKTISSSGVVPGSLQVTPDGDSIMTLNDGQVTGGYPRILVVMPDQLALLAQAQPGDTLYFLRHR